MKLYGISKIKGEFSCKKTEEKYSSYYIEKTNKMIKITIFVLAMANILFIIPDYYAVSDKTIFMSILYDRCIFALAAAVFCFWLRYQENHKNYFKGITVMELFAASMFLHIYWLYENSNYTIQILGLITAMVFFVTIHNRWIYVMLVNVYTVAGFFVITNIIEKPIESMTVTASGVYCVIVCGLLLFRDYQINLYKREQYASKMNLKDASLMDSLTKVPNRAAFEKEIDKVVEKWKRYGNSFSIAMFDIDDFKIVNDTYGHFEGDLVLERLASFVKEQIRNVDFVARWGGEEFVIILPEADMSAALNLVERIRGGIKKADLGKSSITCSFGVTQVRDTDTKESLLKRMDDSLYRCKKEGKDMVLHDIEVLKDIS
jgi:diguanylate cyclase (GGDEF)-like protein